MRKNKNQANKLRILPNNKTTQNNPPPQKKTQTHKFALNATQIKVKGVIFFIQNTKLLSS